MRPDMSEGYIGLARMYSDMDRPEDAREAYQLGEQAGATSLGLYRSWSASEEKNNRLEEAERLAHKALEIDPDYPGLQILRAKLARRRGSFEEALTLLEQVNRDSFKDRITRSQYLFELGDVNDKLKNYPAAFAAYDEANRDKNEYTGRVYDEEEDRQRFDNWKTFFSRENWQRLREIPVDDSLTRPRPVFIVGFPRSGTSLLEQILGSHPEFAAAGELTWMYELASENGQAIIGSGKLYPDMLLDPDAQLDAGKLQAMRDFYLDNTRDLGILAANTRWFTDKLPHNAVHLGLISLLFPESPVIHIARHPFNSCLSAYFANFKPTHRYTSSLESTAKHYCQVMEMLDHYREVVQPRYLEIHYEDLVEDQASVTRQVLDFIGAPWDDACLAHHKSKRVVRTASYEQVTKKVYRSSLHRYRNYADAVRPLLPILAPMLERFGYTADQGL
jgi:tetratricopeptide (TPR) repeat protein